MTTPVAPRRIPLMPLAGLAVVVVAGLAAIALSLGVARLNHWIAHSIRTQVALVSVGERLVTFESNFRGYLLRRNPELMREAITARRALGQRLAELERETADSPVQHRNFLALHALVAERVASADTLIALRRRYAMEQLPARLPGRLIMARLRARSAAMFAEEERLLAIRQGWLQTLAAALALFLTSVVVIVVVVAYLTVTEARARFRELEQAQDATRRETDKREQAENELRQMQKMETLGQLTGGIAHDFNNMLAVIIGSLDMARRKAGADAEGSARCIATALDGAERAAALVRRLLAFSRRQALSPVALDVNRLLAGMDELLGRTLGEQVVVATALAPDAWQCFADPGQLENAILNLAVNARDAMEGGDGRLTLATDNVTLAPAEAGIGPAAGEYVRVSVADTGRGMAPEVIERAFDPFFTTKELGKGTGLGLSQVFGFTSQSGGHVAIESSPGAGTVVRLHLPRFRGAPAPAVRAAPPPLASARSGETILVAEDEPHVRAFSIEALRELGYDVLSAADGAEALRQIETRPEIVLLFTDIMMPGMTGHALADAARRLRPDLRLLFTTGYAADNAGDVARIEGTLLPKPFTVAQLAAKVRAAIDG